MKTVLVTGAGGFIGKNLVEALSRIADLKVYKFDVEDNEDKLKQYLKDADFVYHLAGINRPKSEEEFKTGNTDLTKSVIQILQDNKKSIPIFLSSSYQATLQNPYGISKKLAEDVLIEYAKKNNTKTYIYRLTNVFGKWCRPNYNSVVATFCYNISHNIDITISDVNKVVELVYIDDVVSELISLMTRKDNDYDNCFYSMKKTFKITLGELAERLNKIRDIRSNLVIPDLSDELTKYLYATYLSYLEKNNFSYPLLKKSDNRGDLAELLKSGNFGQVFISTSRKGIKRGNHYHNTKIEKFCVIKGKAQIKLRHINKKEVIKYDVDGENLVVLDIPPGYTHSIENTGDDEMIALFWANEIFDPNKPDTNYLEV
ncbi:MAG: NAD-dependent epimerase/dehydratase family protein [Elusimicrobia bacterium]|nr:NAD-dependent epimerase/dehydratase family protein [Candidatus Liberimonas magnetica]